MFAGLGNYFGNLVQSEQSRREKLLESMRIGSMCVSYDLFDVNFDHLRRKRAFVKGVDIRIREEMDKEKLMGFANLPDIVPIKPKNQTLSNVDYVELMKASEEESKEEGTPGQSGLFDYDTENEAAKNAEREKVRAASPQEGTRLVSQEW